MWVVDGYIYGLCYWLEMERSEGRSRSRSRLETHRLGSVALHTDNRNGSHIARSGSQGQNAGTHVHKDWDLEMQ